MPGPGQKAVLELGPGAEAEAGVVGAGAGARRVYHGMAGPVDSYWNYNSVVVGRLL